MFENLKPVPQDPILDLLIAYQNDPAPDKIDLGAGVYRDDSGQVPIFDAVKKAEQTLWREETTKVYTPMAGDGRFLDQIRNLVFGADHLSVREERVKVVQAPGGCGGLRLAAETVRRINGEATVWLGTPTWANHYPIMEGAGLTIRDYPYYDMETHRIDFDAMMSALSEAGPNDLVLLHGCCHNPTGADLDRDQWRAVAHLAGQRGWVPFVDLAYQGFAEGIEPDAQGPRILADTVPEMFVVSSCSKNFGLYRERVGALMVQMASADKAAMMAGMVMNTARRAYTMPPSHGGAVAGMILADPALRASWEAELGGMRQRINGLRHLFVEAMGRRDTNRDFSFITGQYGMFSYLGLSETQVETLRRDYSIYMVGSSRINVAGINKDNVERLADAIASVLNGTGG